MFQCSPPDVTPGVPKMNKFEQVSSDHYQLLLAAGVGYPTLLFLRWGRG